MEQLLARRLRAVAAQKGVALSQVADRAGIARSYIWRLLRGRSSATLAAIQRLADALGVEPLVLITEGAEPGEPQLAEGIVPRSKRRRAGSSTKASRAPSKALARRRARPRQSRGV